MAVTAAAFVKEEDMLPLPPGPVDVLFSTLHMSTAVKLIQDGSTSLSLAVQMTLGQASSH